MIEMRVCAGNPLRIATSPRSVRKELAKKFSNQMPSSLSRRMQGITGSPSTVSSMIVRAKLSRITTTTLGRPVVSTRSGSPAEGPLPRNASNFAARVASSKKGYSAA